MVSERKQGMALLGLRDCDWYRKAVTTRSSDSITDFPPYYDMIFGGLPKAALCLFVVSLVFFGSRPTPRAAIRTKPPNDLERPLLAEGNSRQFAILLKLAVHSANILKGPATEKGMIAALNRLTGTPLPGRGIVNTGQRVVPGPPREMRLLFPTRGPE
jgi:hypothetical protein